MLKIDRLSQQAEKKAADTQPWPYHFRLKTQELKLLFDFLNIGKVGTMLEIGCGNAFNSVLFSDKADRIIATDLPDYNLGTSTIGMEHADRLIQGLNVGNIALLGCRAEKLPFNDESFDLVFSSFVLEHVDDKEKAVSEMSRVLKKDGIVIALVPNFMERLSAPLHFYPYLFKRGLVYLLKLLGFSPANNDSTVVASVEEGMRAGVLPFSKRIKKFLKDYPNFPCCSPHGNYRCWRDEFLSHLPVRWKRLFEANGLKIKALYSTMFIPHNFLTAFSEKTAYRAYLKSAPLTKRIGKKPIFKYLGYNLCLVAQK